MIYITFFIGILIDKRGVREAERGGKARTTGRTTEHYTRAHHQPSGKEREANEKRQAAHHPAPPREKEV